MVAGSLHKNSIILQRTVPFGLLHFLTAPSVFNNSRSWNTREYLQAGGNGERIYCVRFGKYHNTTHTHIGTHARRTPEKTGCHIPHKIFIYEWPLPGLHSAYHRDSGEIKLKRFRLADWHSRNEISGLTQTWSPIILSWSKLILVPETKGAIAISPYLLRKCNFMRYYTDQRAMLVHNSLKACRATKLHSDLLKQIRLVICTCNGNKS